MSREIHIDPHFQFIQEILDLSFLLLRELGSVSKHFGLTEMEARFLIFVGMRSSPKGIPLREFVCFFRKHKSTVRQKLKTLEEKGYVQLLNDPNDHREKRVFLTGRGKKLFQELETKKEEKRKEIFKSFHEKEITHGIKMFHRLNEVLRKNERYENCRKD